MLTVPNFKFPRRISIRVAKAEKLSLSKKDNKKKNNSKFRVVVLGGKKKETSTWIDDPSGNPEWNFSCIVKLHLDKNDPICLLVEDSEGHHKGQVVIPLVKICPKPYTYSPDQNPATSSNVICSELEPTKLCSNAIGYLIYWMWVEEYRTQEDEQSKSSFKSSMSNIFGSMHTIGSHKSRSSAGAGSVSNISSAMSLNKPESHKKTLSFLHIKSKKDKAKKSTSDYKLTPDSSDVESHTEIGNPFESDISHSRHATGSNKESFGSSDFHYNNKSNNPFNITVDPLEHPKSYNQFSDHFDVLSHGSHGSISESGSVLKFGQDKKVSDSQTSLVNMTPVTLPPIKANMNISDNQYKSKQSNKYNSAQGSGNQDMNWPVKSGSPSEDVSGRYKYSHKAVTDGDNSMFIDYSINQPTSTTMKMLNDEAEYLRKENSDLKFQNINCCRTISELQNELDFFKDSLFKLRTRLLTEGGTEFLEKL